jgi:SAM-dependent methyltransferase
MDKPRTPEQWDTRYREGATPWNIGRPGAHLQAAVKSGLIAPCRLLEVGCGTGTDAVWLARQGFEVTACDISGIALAQAKDRAKEHDVKIAFVHGSFPDERVAFDVAYDRGVFHVPEEREPRAQFAASVAACLRAEGLWVSLSGSTDGPPRDHGPPRLSVRDIAEALEPHFEIISLTDTMFEADLPSPARGFWTVARKRASS